MPKLIQVNGKAMATQALANLPKTDTNVFVLRTDLPDVTVVAALNNQTPTFVCLIT